MEDEELNRQNAKSGQGKKRNSRENDFLLSSLSSSSLRTWRLGGSILRFGRLYRDASPGQPFSSWKPSIA
jgi:hypothetical protein